MSDDINAKLIAELKSIHNWLTSEYWGTIQYMDCDIYDDADKIAKRIEELFKMSDTNEVLLDINQRMVGIFFRSLDGKSLPGDAEEAQEIIKHLKELEKKYNIPPTNWRLQKMEMLKELQDED